MLRDRILGGLAHAALHRRGVIYAIWAVACLVAVGLIAAFGLHVDTSRTNMVSEDNVHQARYQAFLRDFGAALSVVVVIEGDDVAKNRAYADALARALEEDAEHVGHVVHKVRPDAFRRFGLLYADAPRLEAARDLLKAVDDAVDAGPSEVVRVEGATGLLRRLNDLFARLEEGDTEGMAGLSELGDDPDDRSLARVFETLDTALADPDWGTLALVRAADPAALDTAGADARGYLAAEDGRLVFLFVQPASSNDQADYLIEFVDSVQKKAQELKPEGVWVGATGYPAYIAAEMKMVSRDLVVTTIISVVGVLLLFILMYGSLATSAIVFLPLTAGVLVDLGFVAVSYGRINMLSSGFLAFLVGLGVDFGIHLAARFDESIRNGRSLEQAVRDTVVSSGPGVVTGAVTTIAAFLATAFTEFTGMQELAIISAAGLLLTLLAALTLGPSLLIVHYERLVRAGKPWPAPRTRHFVVRGATALVRRPIAVLVGAALVTVAFAPAIRPLQFSFDLVSFLDRDQPARAAYEKLKAADIFSPDYAVMVAHSAEEARAHGERLATRPDLVSRVDSAATYLPPDQEAKAPLVREVKQGIARLPRLELTVPEDPQPADFIAQLEAVAEYLEVDLPLTMRMHGRERLQPGVVAAAKSARAALATARALPEDELGRRLSRIAATLSEILSDLQGFARSEQVLMTPLDLPREVRDATFKQGPDGDRWLVRIYPRGSMTDPEFMERFNDFAQSIDPEVTGLPITFLAWGVLLRDGLERSAVYAALIILLLLLVDFRALRPTLLALFPIVLGLVWMVGAMNAFDIGYNFANVIAIPLILGIGIDSGVHVVHRWLQGTAPTDLPATTGKAVIVSSLTTIIGFGALLASDHGGIRSLGLTLTIGVAASMIGASLVLPALLEAIRRLREPR